MKSLLVQIDEPTFRALNRVAPAVTRQRAEFVRNAIRTAIRIAEEHKAREAYAKMPDAETEADDWSGAEAWSPSKSKLGKRMTNSGVRKAKK